MTYDPSAAYRSTQVASSNPVTRVVLLYQGAIRFGAQHLAALERDDVEAAHNASMRCQAIVATLQETLDLTAGPVAGQLDQLYDFMLRQLATGNITKTARPTQAALTILRELLGTWQDIARAPVIDGSGPRVRPAPNNTGTHGASYGAALP